jgi:hypothetical protein
MIQAPQSELLNTERRLSLAYQRCLEEKSPFTADVLEDLSRFCRGKESTFHPDPRVHALQEGRREVLLRILDYLTLSPEELLKKHVVIRHDQPRSNK